MDGFPEIILVFSIKWKPIRIKGTEEKAVYQANMFANTDFVQQTAQM